MYELCTNTKLHNFCEYQGSFCVKSPNGLNLTDSDFNEIWYTCYLGTHSTKSKILGQSDQWCGRYGPPNFENFGKNRCGCSPLNPHIAGMSDPILIKLVLMDRHFDKDSKYIILFQIGQCCGALTCWLLDLSAAYDTVWLRGLHLKLLQMIPDRHMVKFIMEMLYNRSFTLNTSDGQCSRQRRLKNGVPQGSVLAPMLFNVYIHDLPVTQAKKYGYADDLAILLQKKSWEDIEGGLTADMTILSTYLENWRLKLSIAKTMSSVFHLHNKEANREINITVNGNRLQFQSAPTYLGVKLDRTLSFRQHLENLSAKTTARVALIRRLAGTTWGAATKTLKVSTLALVYSAAEYCAPVWCRSSHTKKLDTVLNSAMRTVSGCLRATPVNHLPILSGIAPPTLRREAAVLALSRKAQANEDHLLHRMLQERPTRARLKSRRPFSQQAHHLSDLAPPGVTKQSWLRTRWKDDWLAAPPSRLHNFIRDPHSVPGLDLPRKQWTTLNRLRTGVGRFSSSMLKWGLKDSSVCECGAPEQTVDHILDVCPQHRPPSGREGIVSLDEDTRAWLASTGLEIWETYARRRTCWPLLWPWNWPCGSRDF